MLRQACTHVQIVPFKRPPTTMATKYTETVIANSVALMGLLERPVKPQSFFQRSALLVPMLPSPALASLPSSTPCSLVYLDFYYHLAPIAAAHLTPGHHIYVYGALKHVPHPTITSWSTLRVSVHSLKLVQDAPPPGSIMDPGALQALVTDNCSRWRAFFHSPSEWQGFGKVFPAFLHKPTGVKLWAQSSGTPKWVLERLASSYYPKAFTGVKEQELSNS